MMEKNEEDIEKKEEKNTINYNQENESENMRADKLTNIANTLVFTIPIFIWFINLICPINELIVILIKASIYLFLYREIDSILTYYCKKVIT